jgi:two-component system, OmpR family, sensor kinase
VVGGATYFAVNRFLLIQLDDQLQASARIYAAACQHHDDGDLPGGDGPTGTGCGTFPGQAANTLDVSVRNGILTSQNLVNGECDLTAAERAALAGVPADGQPRTVDLPSLGGDYRLTAMPGPGHDVLVTGVPMASMEATLHSVEITELIVFAGVLVLAGVLGTGLVRVSLRPLRRVAATASRVAQLPLADGQARLPVRVAGTNPGTEVGQVATARPHPAGHRRDQRRARGWPGAPLGAGAARRAGPGARGRVPAPSGDRQPAEQRPGAHATRDRGDRPARRPGPAARGAVGDRRRPRHTGHAAARPVRPVRPR